MFNINEGKLGVDKFAHTHTHTHTHTHERRELLSSECNFNSRSNKGGGRYLISSALKALGEYIYIYIYISRREVAV